MLVKHASIRQANILMALLFVQLQHTSTTLYKLFEQDEVIAKVRIA